MTADRWPLPGHAYRPGQNARHPEGWFDEIRAAAPMPTTTAGAAGNPPWCYGHRLFAAGYFWEAHEVWEPVWLNAPPRSAERLICQSLIQIANAALKRDMGKPKAARRLCDMAAALLAEACLGGESNPMGIAPAEAEAAITMIRADLTSQECHSLPYFRHYIS